MNKKILAGLILGALIATIALPALAQENIPTSCIIRADPQITNCPTSGNCDFNNANAPCAVCCLVGSVAFISNWIFTAIILLVVIFVLLGAFNIVTAAGDTNKITSGKNYILYAAIGLACALLAKAVPNIVRYMVSGV